MSHAAPTPRQRFATTLRRPGVGRVVARTAGFNVASTAAAGLGGVILARALGPTVRGEYAAITAWFGVALIVGSMGQPAALCFHVASDPLHAREYVATSRAMMLITGTLVLLTGIVIAPLLAHGNTEVTIAYRVAFSASIVAFVGASYTFSLQARNIGRWNIVRLSQPVLGLIAIIVLWRLRLLSLVSALVALCATMLIQLCWAYRSCRISGLAPGRARVEFVRPLSRYGVAQIAALTPATLNAQLDQLILSQAVPSAALGRYAIAVSLTLLPIPVVSAIGNVAFPRLAASGTDGAHSYRVQRLAVISSAALATGLLCPLALVAYWVVPWVFGVAYSGVVPLLWIMTPGAICLACNQVVGDLLRGRKLPIVVARAEGMAVVFTVVLLFALLPFIGVYSAAIASTVAYAVALFAMLRHVRAPSRAHGKGRRAAHGGVRMES